MEGGDGGGVVRVEVEDTSLAADGGDGEVGRNGMGMGLGLGDGMDMDQGEVFEGVEHDGTWDLPSQTHGLGLGGGVRIAPTARPPL